MDGEEFIEHFNRTMEAGIYKPADGTKILLFLIDAGREEGLSDEQIIEQLSNQPEGREAIELLVRRHPAQRSTHQATNESNDPPGARPTQRKRSLLREDTVPLFRRSGRRVSFNRSAAGRLRLSRVPLARRR